MSCEYDDTGMIRLYDDGDGDDGGADDDIRMVNALAVVSSSCNHLPFLSIYYVYASLGVVNDVIPGKKYNYAW